MNKRVLIAGFEIGGQMQLLAETMRKRGIKAQSLSFNADSRKYTNDLHLNPVGFVGSIKRILFFCKALFQYDVFHFFWGVSLVAFWRIHLIDLPILRFFNKKIIVHFRGTDLINVEYYDYLLAKAKGIEMQAIPKSRPDQLKKLNVWRKYAHYVLVSTPDLLFAAPNAIISPQVINLEEWQPTDALRPENQSPVLKIVHAPTRRAVKGTEFIIKAVEDLKSEGWPIELKLLENIPAKEIKGHFNQCDIGIDQLLHGWYGKVAVELMAMKKPVICHIKEEFGQYGPGLPIVDATPENIKVVLESLIQDHQKRKTVGDASLKYAKKNHDVEAIVDELLNLYGFEKNNKKTSYEVEENNFGN